jgi:hypothetical protein
VPGDQDHLEASAAAKPGDPSHWHDLVRGLLEDDRPDEALGVIDTALREGGLSDAIVFALLMDKGRAYRALQDLGGASDAFAAALAIRPEDEAALEQISLTLMTSKRFAEATTYHARLHALQARQLPQRLTDGLAEIRRRTEAIALDAPAVAWAWEVADQAAWDRDAWQAAAAWGQEARVLLRRWWQTASPQQVGQLAELVVPPDLSAFRAAALEHSACILVGAHVGPTAVPVHLFQRANWPFRTLGTADRDRVYGETMMPVFTNSITTMRTIVTELKSGTTIGFMADAPTARDRLVVEFLGRTVELPLQIPKLIQRYATASFWCCPLWRQGRVIIEVARLPDPLPDEPRQAWCERWFAAYLARLEPVMRGHPENLGLFSGIWSNVNAAALRRRRQGDSVRRAKD